MGLGEDAMTIKERTVGNVTILDLVGKLTLGDGDEMLKDEIWRLLQQGRKLILLNLGKISYIDSAGLGEFVRTFTTVTKYGGKLKLLNPTQRIHGLLSIKSLIHVFETFDDETEAVWSFNHHTVA